MFIRTERSLGEFIRFYPVVFTIALINIGLWVLTGLTSTSLGRMIIDYGIGSNISINVLGQYWRLVTPIFLHADFEHVLFNTFSLILFGPALERLIGKYKFLFVYLIAGIIGNLGTYLLNPMSIIEHLGASGSVYGLFGIYIYMTFFRKDLINSTDGQIVKTIFLLGVIMTVLMPNINVAAHLFGFIGGFIQGPLFLKKSKPFSNQPGQGIYEEKAFQRDLPEKKITDETKGHLILGFISLLLLAILFFNFMR